MISNGATVNRERTLASGQAKPFVGNGMVAVECPEALREDCEQKHGSSKAERAGASGQAAPFEGIEFVRSSEEPGEEKAVREQAHRQQQHRARMNRAILHDSVIAG